MKQNEDVALNSMSAGWMNEFVEVVLGSAIVIPIAVGYLGIDKVKELGGFAMGFVTLPYLFAQWGDFLSKMAGFMWFGLLFFAGITSSLAMGTPLMGFLKDNFNWTHNKSAIAFGALVFILGIPCVMSQNGFNEYDYWAGTVSLVVFALAEIILFAWVFGMEKGWSEITRGADIHVPGIYKPIIQYITPVFLLAVFIGSIPDIITNISSETDLWGWISRGTLIALFIVISYYVKVASINLKPNNI